MNVTSRYSHVTYPLNTLAHVIRLSIQCYFYCSRTREHSSTHETKACYSDIAPAQNVTSTTVLLLYLITALQLNLSM